MSKHAEMVERYTAIAAVVEEINPCTVRQVFYQCVVRGIVEKTEAAYDKVQRALLHMRREEIIEYSAIVDSSRMHYKPTTFDTPEEAMRDLGSRLRLNIWRESPWRLEFWLEKLALAAVVGGITTRWNVPLYVSRGFSSESYLYTAAEQIVEADRYTQIFLLTDYDPSGLKIEEAIVRRLPELVDDLGGDPDMIEFQRLGLTTEQIEEYSLPSRPTKASSHSAGFEGDSTELDALHPDVLRALVEDTILEYTDDDQVERIGTEEKLARDGLMAFDFARFMEMRHAAKPDENPQ